MSIFVNILKNNYIMLFTKSFYCSPQCYPLAPNICVEAGRIRFIRHDISETSADAPSIDSPVVEARITVTRGLQTEAENDEAFQVEKKYLEQRISELETTLELAQKNEERDRLIINKLQKQMARRETAHRDVDRERRLRIDSETRSKQAIQEANRCKSRLKLLTSEFTRMEDTVRSMLEYKRQAEQFRQEKTELTLAHENRCHHYQTTISRLNLEVESLRRQLKQVCSDPNPDSIFSAHTATLHRQAEDSRKQYEKCLDEVANQVVKALLTQKSLREEVTVLSKKIHHLESQNTALTTMLVHQLKENCPNSGFPSRLALQDYPIDVVDPCSAEGYNSFSSKALGESSNKDNSAEADENNPITNVNFYDTKALSDFKSRYQFLSTLWKEFKGTELMPQKLLEALSALNPAVYVAPQRPVSLNLQLPLISSTKYRRSRSIPVQSTFKSEEGTTGNESPESGNGDEGYSTMSSDVHTDVTKNSQDGHFLINGNMRGLEDLKEATEETTELSETRFSDSKDLDIFYIPFNLLNLKSRNSYPPGREVLPFHHIQRSLSESNLCIKITAAPSPSHKFSSPTSSSPSILVVDISERKKKCLRKKRPTSNLWGNSNIEFFEEKLHPSWPHVIDDKLESWDTEYIQHWLRLDETRTAIQQHRDFFELEYDKTELEDWSLSLSNDDMPEIWKKKEVTTPGQISISTLPSIQENNALELEEDSNEYLWNNSSYMMDNEGSELVTLLMDKSNSQSGISWPYALTTNLNLLPSPDNSWSSGGSDYQSYELDTFSKRSSAALSGCSDDTGEIHAIGTDFTRDFYRLVKFESTKSLASTSSISVHGDNADREMILQNVLTFLTEQQKYIYCTEKNSCPFSADELPIRESIDTTVDNQKIDVYNKNGSKDENFVTLRQFCQETSFNDHNLKERMGSEDILLEFKQNIAYANEVCLVKALEVETNNCFNICDVPVKICSMNLESPSDLKHQAHVRNGSHNKSVNDLEIYESLEGELTKFSDTTSSDISINNGSESSSVSTPDTIVSKIPRRKLSLTKTLVSLSRPVHRSNRTKIPKMKVLKECKQTTSPQKQKNINFQQAIIENVVTSEEQEELPQSTSNIIVACPSFHERATSKDVIDELNRLIKNGEENVIVQEQVEFLVNARLDQNCKPTGWLHVERDIDISDPKARANLLDVMMASVSSDSSPTSSSGGSIASDTTEEPPDYGHLHKIHRSHRQKKAKANRLEMAVVRASQSVPRPTIIGRTDIFVRYGDKEREAVASFDFLDHLSGSSPCCSVEDQLDEVKGNGGVRMRFSFTQV